MCLQYDQLRLTSGWDLLASLGHPCKFQPVLRLGSITARHSIVVSVSQTLRRGTEGATYIRQCGHHVGHWPTFLVLSCFLWRLYGADADIIMFAPWFLLSIFFYLFPSLYLSRLTLDVYHTSTHGVALVHANLGCRSETSCRRLSKIQDAKIAKNSPSAHYRTALSGYIFATKALSTIWKDLLNSNISSTCG